MVITDTIDGRLMVRLLQRVSHQTEAMAYRRMVGWIVVMLSYGMGLYGAATRFFHALELGSTAVTVTGFLLFVGSLAGYLWLIRRPPSSQPLSQE